MIHTNSGGVEGGAWDFFFPLLSTARHGNILLEMPPLSPSKHLESDLGATLSQDDYCLSRGSFVVFWQNFSNFLKTHPLDVDVTNCPWVAHDGIFEIRSTSKGIVAQSEDVMLSDPNDVLGVAKWFCCQKTQLTPIGGTIMSFGDSVDISALIKNRVRLLISEETCI